MEYIIYRDGKDKFEWVVCKKAHGERLVFRPICRCNDEFNAKSIVEALINDHAFKTFTGGEKK